MIISHRKKFAFFANQRTGSKAVGIVLRFSGIFDENDILIAQPFPATRTAIIDIPAYNLNGHESHIVNHMTPEEAIEAGFITLDQLREYDCYAFLREPEARFRATRVSKQVDRNGTIAMPGRKVSGRVAPPQYKFFFVGDEQVVTPLDFDNFEIEIKNLIIKLGGHRHMDIPRAETVAARMLLDIQYIPSQHTRDIQLYKQMKANANSNT
jgi:hypothetical protein